MPDALYVYGIVKIEHDRFNWKEIGIEKKNVYIIREGGFDALVHDCEEKPYTSKYPEKVKELIIAHNDILDRAMRDFGGAIPLHFNTIIKEGENSARNNLKKWLCDEKERLEGIWDKVKGKKEYGIRIYYEKDKLIQEASDYEEVKEVKKSQQKKSQGLNYLLEKMAESKIKDIFQKKVSDLKQEIYDDIKRITNHTIVNPSRISISEEKDLLLSLSVLVDNDQLGKIKKFLEENSKELPFQLVGPFAPYSFVENGTQ